jgi:NAD+ kinase
MTRRRPLPPVSRIGIVAKSHLRKAVPHLVEISAWLEAHRITAVFETATAALMSLAGGRIADKRELVEQVDMVLVLGGDGTLLSMAERIGEARSQIPILGVNFGSLGFLTEVTLPELYRSLDAAVAGQAVVEERLMIRSTTLRGGSTFAEHIVLNDVVVTKGAHSRMIDLSVWVGDEFVTRVKADGLIVASPTGSTAYNLAAGGPVVQPDVDALIVTPIAPHTLTNRPIVIPAFSPIRVRPSMDDHDEVFVTFDGQAGLQLRADDEIRVCRADQPIHLIRSSTRSYFEVLREKLKWGER